MAETNSKFKEIELEIKPVEINGELSTVVYLPVVQDEHATGLKRFIPSTLLTVIVILPLLMGLAYNFMIASHRFVSTASFVVRENKKNASLASMLEGGGLGRSDENSFAVSEFIRSRDVMEKINRDGFLGRIFSAPDVDMFSRFRSIFVGSSNEDFYAHFQNYVDVSFNTSTGITTLSVQAFTSEDAKELAVRLVNESEALVNSLNSHAKLDVENFAEETLREARSAVEAIQSSVTKFRDENKILNADSELIISNGLIGEMQKNIATVDAEISRIAEMTPNNPRLSELRVSRKYLVEELKKIRSSLAGGDDSIAKKLEQYEMIAIRQKIAETNLVNAEAALLKARQSSATEKLYLDVVAAPNSPDRFSYPKRFINIALIFFISFSSFVIIRSLRDLIMEEG